jgi:hypothetical protein
VFLKTNSLSAKLLTYIFRFFTGIAFLFDKPVDRRFASQHIEIIKGSDSGRRVKGCKNCITRVHVGCIDRSCRREVAAAVPEAAAVLSADVAAEYPEPAVTVFAEVLSLTAEEVA